ncbi:MAG: hypothetical protein EXS58_09940 [Candidatus Latescibacteria bacterium]|nr:hypothetical protein [Candidatus Latescibacterota bacterium]
MRFADQMGLLFFAVFYLGLGIGCEKVPGPHALAVVGEEEIAPEDLQRFEARINPAYRSTGQGAEVYRDYLQSLIDVKLMVMEAQALGLDRDPALVAAVVVVKKQAMIDAYLRVKLGQGIQLSEQELRESFAAHPASQAVRGAHILLATQQDAEAAYAELKAGKSFAAVARRRSLDRQTAAKGGAFDQYYAFDRVSDRIYGKVFKEMKVGQVSAPFRTPQGYEIVRVLDKKPLDYEKYRTVITRGTVMQKFEQLKAGHIAALADSLGVRVDPVCLQRLIEAWNAAPGRPALSPQEQAAPLYRFAGGQLAVGEAVEWLAAQRAALDSAQVEQILRKKAVPEAVLAAAAEKVGFAEYPQVQRQVREERERRLLEALWKKELEEEVVATEEEARAHYAAHPELYQVPAEIVIQEILAPTREEAESLLAQIRDGADMGKLAAEHSIRLHAEQNGGIYGMRAFERVIYKEVMDAALRDSSGQVQGPVRVDRPLRSALKDKRELAEAYSICKVLERLPARRRPFEEAIELSLFYARQEKQQHRLDELNEQLRRKYRRQWAIGEEALRHYDGLAAPE